METFANFFFLKHVGNLGKAKSPTNLNNVQIQNFSSCLPFCLYVALVLCAAVCLGVCLFFCPLACISTNRSRKQCFFGTGLILTVGNGCTWSYECFQRVIVSYLIDLSGFFDARPPHPTFFKTSPRFKTTRQLVQRQIFFAYMYNNCVYWMKK